MNNRQADKKHALAEVIPELDRVAKQALAAWGTDSQEMVALGELGELIALFGRRAQKRDTPAEWIDEIADGFIMMTQLANIHGMDAVCARLRQKLEKLQARIDRQTPILATDERKDKEMDALIREHRQQTGNMNIGRVKPGPQ